MNHVTRGGKKPVNLTLSAELVREVRTLTPNLSETVEALLADYVSAERVKKAAREQEVDTAIAFLNEQYRKHGGIGEEYSPF
jgi:antitoxin CcdA